MGDKQQQEQCSREGNNCAVFQRECDYASQACNFEVELINIRPDAQKQIEELNVYSWSDLEKLLNSQQNLLSQIDSGQLVLPDNGKKVMLKVELLESLFQHRPNTQAVMQQPQIKEPTFKAKLHSEEEQQKERQGTNNSSNWLQQARNNQKDHKKERDNQKSKVRDFNRQLPPGRKTNNKKKPKTKNIDPSQQSINNHLIRKIQVPKLLNTQNQNFVENCKRPCRLESIDDDEPPKILPHQSSGNDGKRQKTCHYNNFSQNQNHTGGQQQQNNIYSRQNNCINQQQFTQEIAEQQFSKKADIGNNKIKCFLGLSDENRQDDQIITNDDVEVQNDINDGKIHDSQHLHINSQNELQLDDPKQLQLQQQQLEQYRDRHRQNYQQTQNQSSSDMVIEDLHAPPELQKITSQGQQKVNNQSFSESQVVDLCTDNEVDDVIMQDSQDLEEQYQQQIVANQGQINLSITEQKLGDVKCIYPQNDSENSGIELRAVDVSKLEPQQYTHDTVIEFYEKFVRQKLSAEKLIRYHFFSTYFLTRLCSKDSPVNNNEDNTHKMQKWLKNVDIFDKEFLFFPFNDSLHWSLFIVCYPKLLTESEDGKCFIMHLDPIPEYHQVSKVTGELRKLLKFEFKRQCTHNPHSYPARSTSGNSLPNEYFSGRHIPFVRANVPSQDNSYDCGLFVCAYVEYFLTCLPDEDQILQYNDVKNSSKGKHSLESWSNYPDFLMQEWFPARNGELLRDYIRFLMLEQFVIQADSQFKNTDSYQWAKQQVNSYNNQTEKYRNPDELMFHNVSSANQLQEQQSGRVTRQQTRQQARRIQFQQQNSNTWQQRSQQIYQDCYGNQNRRGLRSTIPPQDTEEQLFDVQNQNQVQRVRQGVNKKTSAVAEMLESSPESKKGDQKNMPGSSEVNQECVDLTDAAINF